MTPEERDKLNRMGGILAVTLGELIGTDVKFAFVWQMIEKRIAEEREADDRELRNLIEDAIKAAIAEKREACAKLVEAMWMPSVGGYPSGPEIAAAIRRSA